MFVGGQVAMGIVELVSVLVTLFIVFISVVVSLVVTALSFLIPLAIVFYVVKNGNGGFTPTIQISGLGAELLAASLSSGPAGRPAPKEGCAWVKRSTCRACGSPKMQRSLSAYVYCDFCGELMDWDFQACLADTRSKQPGPVYERLLAESRGALERAKVTGNRSAYQELQRRLYDAYATHCPAALPPRIGDPRYREALVAWLAEGQVAQDLDPDCAASMAEQQRLTSALQWDRANPFQPQVSLPSFWPLLAAVMAHQRNVVGVLERDGLLERHPDRPSGEVFLRMGASAMAQGWISYLPPDAVERLLEETGLQDDFVELEVPELVSGPCPCCSAPLEVVQGAKRVLCHSCGHMAGVGGGAMRCHGCAAPVEVPADTNLFACPRCDAELRMMRAS